MSIKLVLEGSTPINRQNVRATHCANVVQVEDHGRVVGRSFDSYSFWDFRVQSEQTTNNASDDCSIGHTIQPWPLSYACTHRTPYHTYDSSGNIALNVGLQRKGLQPTRIIYHITARNYQVKY